MLLQGNINKFIKCFFTLAWKSTMKFVSRQNVRQLKRLEFCFKASGTCSSLPCHVSAYFLMNIKEKSTFLFGWLLAVKTKQNTCKHCSVSLIWGLRGPINRRNCEDLGEYSEHAGLHVIIAGTYVTLKEQSLRLANGSSLCTLSCLGVPSLWWSAAL